MSSFKPTHRIHKLSQNPIFPEEIAETAEKMNDHHLLSLLNKTQASNTAEVAFVVCISLYPETLLTMYENLKRNLQQTFQLFVVDDCQNSNDTTNLFLLCELIHVVYIRNPMNKHILPVKRHMAALTVGLQHVYPSKFKYIGSLDSDVFLLEKLDLDWIFEIYDAIATRKCDDGETDYMWGGFAIWTSKKFNLDKLRWDMAAESGEVTKNYINPEKILWLDTMGANSFLTFLPKSIQLYCKQFNQYESELGFMNDKPLYIHLKNVSNWEKRTSIHHKEQIVCFLRAIDLI